ncbi:DHA2 family efflux MFS transporter permease subunit [Peribacillus asahii]|uniref:DHA2 family efflux MFS transporter permease subunit n=1 Tax=Peribacillus asahii TaxID=228899 RepID=UPI0038208F78
MSDSANAKRPPYGIIGILLAGAFIAFLNGTLLNIALPSIMKDFDISATTVQWLVTGYMLVNGVLIPTTAFLIQKYSVRHLFLIAMLLFTIGTVASAVAPSFTIILAGRMIQAAGSAIMMPLLMNVMLTSFPIEKRGTAMGVFGLVMIFAPAIGPTLSGWIIEHYTWRTLFYMIAPIAALIVIFAFFMLKDKKEKVNITLDILSLVLSSIGFGGLLYGFSSAGDKGWGDIEVYGTIIIGAIALILFILRQLKLERPMLDFRIYKHPMFALSSVISMVVNMALFSAMILMPIYVQTIRGISPIHSGLLMLPGAIVMGIMSPITGKLFDKHGARSLAIIGLVITAVSTYYFSTLSLTTPYWELITLYTVRMFGMSMVMMPIMTNGLNQLPQRMNPHGTAMNNTLSQVSGAIGSALLVTVMSKRTEAHAEELMESAMSQVTGQPTAEALAAIKGEVMVKAMVDGINDAFLVATVLIGVALLLSLFIKRAKPAEEIYAKEAPKHA